MISASTDTILPGNYHEEFVITTIFSGKMMNEKIILIYSQNPETGNDVHTCILKPEFHLPKINDLFQSNPFKNDERSFYFLLHVCFILKIFKFLF